MKGSDSSPEEDSECILLASPVCIARIDADILQTFFTIPF
jgi:hypothetical protein